jgi:2-octaprenylphenol hydroxylase
MDRMDVAIVGRGAVGLAAALALARPGRRVALVGSRPGAAPDASSTASAAPQDWDPRVFALSPASRTLLASVGAWQRLPPERVAPVYDMRIVNATGADLPDVHLDAYRSRIEALAWIVENRALQAALLDRVRAAVQAGTLVEIQGTVTGLLPPPHGWARNEPVTLVLDHASGDGSGATPGPSHRLTASLVVAADGIDSPVREFARIGARRIDHRQTAIVANFDCERPTRDVAWQWFGDDGVLALLPLPAPGPALPAPPLEAGVPALGRVSLVWSVPEHRLAAALDCPLAESIGRITGDRHGLLRQTGPTRSFPLRSVRARSVLAPGVVLVGDAAHAVHPMAGQGMNLGFGDVAALAATLGTGSAAEPLGSYLRLRRYERSRAEAVAVMQAGLSALERLFAGPPVAVPLPLARLRDLGWRVVAQSGWLRRRMVRHAVS